MQDYQLVQEAIAGIDSNARGYVRVSCPLCVARIGSDDRHRALSVRVGDGWYGCWRCGARGWIRGVGYGGPEQPEDPDQGAVALPEGFISLSDAACKGSLLAQGARQYLLGRGVTDEVIQQADVGYVVRGSYNNRVLVPVLSSVEDDCNLVGWVARAINDTAQIKYIYPKGMKRGDYLLNEDALSKDTNIPILVVEGALDALPYWPNAVACLGKPTTAQEKKLHAARRPLVIALDGDSWVEGMALATRLKLEGKQDVDWRKLPPGQDPGSYKVKL